MAVQEFYDQIEGIYSGLHVICIRLYYTDCQLNILFWNWDVV